MKFLHALLLAFGTLLCGCTSQDTSNGYELKIDSAVNARIADHRTRLAVKNDSILIALENARADSLARNAAGKVGTMPNDGNSSTQIDSTKKIR